MIPTSTLTATLTPTNTLTNTVTFTPSPTSTHTPSVTYTPSATYTPSETLSPTISPSPTVTPTPVATFPKIDVVNCVPENTTREIGQVIRVIDGDTIEVRIDGTDYMVRYIGIDTPEKDNNFGVYASNKNSELVSWKWVTLVKDVSETDQYDRLLRYVFVGDQFVNYELVVQGFAHAEDYSPDSACKNTFSDAQNQARSSEVGIWKPTPTPRPTVIPTLPPQPTSPPSTTGGTTAGGSNSDNCDPSYPTVCIPPPPPDLDCGEISHRRFQVIGSDPHRFDGDGDGIGCEN